MYDHNYIFFQKWNTASIEIIRTKLIQDIAKLLFLTNMSVAPELPGPEVTEMRMCKPSHDKTGANKESTVRFKMIFKRVGNKTKARNAQ